MYILALPSIAVSARQRIVTASPLLAIHLLCLDICNRATSWLCVLVQRIDSASMTLLKHGNLINRAWEGSVGVRVGKDALLVVMLLSSSPRWQHADNLDPEREPDNSNADTKQLDRVQRFRAERAQNQG